MQIKEIPLWEGNDKVYLTAYILEKSKEYLADEKKPALLICPGGGYLMTSDREGEPIALKFLSEGYHAFVLRYTTADRGKTLFPQPLLDAARAMQIIHELSEEELVDTDKIAVAGFSAGANLAGLLATRWHEAFLSEALGCENEIFRPALLISGYGMLDYPALMELAHGDPEAERKDPWGSKMDLWRQCNKAFLGSEEPDEATLKKVSPAHHVSKKTPPSFIWHTSEDGLVYPQLTMNFALALAADKIPYEMHIFEKGGHGMSLANGIAAQGDWHVDEQTGKWSDLCAEWMKRHLSS